MQAEIERDIYKALLNLAFHEDVEALLPEALALITSATRARQGYLEIRDDDAGHWWIGHGIGKDDVDDLRGVISRGVIAEALATGETVVTPSALLDPRFSHRESVQRTRIEAVLCAPIGTDPPRGVLYLQGWSQPDCFTAEDRTLAEMFCRYLAQLVDRLLIHRRRKLESTTIRTLRSRLRMSAVIGRSPALAEALEQVALVSPLDVTVLLTGDSGTGKSLLARVIHDNSRRASGPFVEISCATLPDQLIESELFGAVPGAHSTATRRVEGKVSAASRGTLFLDEIGELPLAVQAKLLQLVQSKRYYPLGANKPETADVRLLAATNVDLEDAVERGRFRQDLYYRLQVVPIRVPSLAERKEDIPDLVAFFSREACTKHGLPPLAPSPSVVRVAQSAPWPGNLRQLAHAVEAAAIRAAAEGAAQLEARHLFRNGKAATGGDALSFHERTRRFQADVLRAALEEHDWNVTEVTRRLDLGRSQIYHLIKIFGLART